MIGVYLHFLDRREEIQGIYNAGFENISIMDIAERASAKIESEIVVTESNDPRSYRLNSDKLLSTGYKQQFTVENAMDDVIKAFTNGNLNDDDQYYNIRTMKKLKNI